MKSTPSRWPERERSVPRKSGGGAPAHQSRPCKPAVVAWRCAVACGLLALLGITSAPPPAVAQLTQDPGDVVPLFDRGLPNVGRPVRYRLDGDVVPLFDRGTTLEPPTVQYTPEALITRVGDRVRDRHAREGMFRAYDHFLPRYWENRTVGIEIIDRVARGGTSITFNMTSLSPLDQPNLRTFFEGRTTVAQYADNRIAQQVDPLHYTVTFTTHPLLHRPIRIGDRIEMEFSPFLLPPVTGRLNYYGTAFLYVVGRGGMVPWEGIGPALDSFPMPDEALLGGQTTLHRQYSDEPTELFKQMATNAAPRSAQPFVLGRRLHHTDFGTGAHSEPGNPDNLEIAGKLGSYYTARACVACHVNNGRGLPPAVGAPLAQYLVRVGSDAQGTPHPLLGSTLQSRAASGSPEGRALLAGWALDNGFYGDGTPFTLRRPVYQFTGVVPEFYSIRIAPPLVGLGLLEALDEAEVRGQVVTNGGRIRKVFDPETGEGRLGRFGWKAGSARLRHQAASALINDMGVATATYPAPDRGVSQPSRGPVSMLPAKDVENLVRYLATLGVPPRRELADPQVTFGEALFQRAGCDSCHRPQVRTSEFHPLAELRGQLIRPYTDLLLHDMGPGLADNMGEGDAGPSEWRTPPLWGIGLTAAVNGGEAYLHDGRAASLSEAILWHGGEALRARKAFRKMSWSDRSSLLRFLRSL